MTSTAPEQIRLICRALIALGFTESPTPFDSELLPSSLSDRSFALAPAFEHNASSRGAAHVEMPVSISLAFHRQQLDWHAQLAEITEHAERIVDALVALDSWEPSGEGTADFSTSLAVSATGERIVLTLTTRFGYARRRG